MEFNEKQFEEKFGEACKDFAVRFMQHVNDRYSMVVIDGKNELVFNDAKGEAKIKDDSKIIVKSYVIFLSVGLINNQFCHMTTRNKLNYPDLSKHLKKCVKYMLNEDSEIHDYVIMFEFEDNNVEW